MNIEKYGIHDKDDEMVGDLYDTLDEARAAVPENEPWAIVAYQFEFDDTDLVETSTGANHWPPEKPSRGVL